MTIRGLMTGLLLAIAAAQPTLACQYEFAPEPIGGPSAKFIGRKMGAAATYIDLAIAEGASDVRGADGRISQTSKALSFRVVDRWKGSSADRFILFGSLGEQPPGGTWSMTHWVDEEGRIDPFESVREATVAMPAGGTSCDPPSLTVTPGRLYLIYREADGRLLGVVPYHEGKPPRRGTSIVEVGLWPDSDWARELHVGAVVSQSLLPERTTDPDRATIRFRQPIAPARASELLRDANAQPFAVELVRGGVTSVYRLDAGQAWPGIVADAAAWAEKQATDPALVRAQVRALVDTYPASHLQNDGAKQLLARRLLELAEAPPAAGPVLVRSVAVVGDAAVQRALAARPEVAAVAPAVRVRDRVASEPIVIPAASDGSWSQADGIPLYRRLVSIAGYGVPEVTILGEWKLVGGVRKVSTRK